MVLHSPDRMVKLLNARTVRVEEDSYAHDLPEVTLAKRGQEVVVGAALRSLDA